MGDQVQFALGEGQGLLTKLAFDLSTSGDQDLIAADGSKIIRVYALILSAQAAVTAKIKRAATALTGSLYLSATGGIVLAMQGEPWFKGNAGEAIKLNLSAAIAVGGVVWYTQA